MHRSFTCTSKSLLQPSPLPLPPPKPTQPLLKKPSAPQQQLQQLLTCQICYCPANHLKMCPSCSKIYCQHCILKSLLIKPQCPHCRKHIKDIKSMADCQRFVNQMKGIVEQVLRQKQKQSFRCEQHDVALSYYCVDCERAVCCECKMFGECKEHSVVQVEKRFRERYDRVRAMLAELKVEVREKEELTARLEGYLGQAQDKYQQQLSQIQKLEQSYNQTYFKEVQRQKVGNSQKIQTLQTQLQKLSATKKELKQQFVNNKQQGKFTYQPQFKARLQNSIQQANQKIQLMKKNPTSYKSYLHDLIPAYEYSTFVIENFSQARGKQKCVIYSDPVKMLDCEWKLKIYPNGSESVEGKYLSIYLMMVSQDNSLAVQKGLTQGKRQPKVYQYIVKLTKQQSNPTQVEVDVDSKIQIIFDLKQKQLKSFSRQYSSTFDAGESWGYNKYIQLQELEKLELVKNNRLVIKFGIRRPDYFTEYKSLMEQLEIEEQKINYQENAMREIEG